MDVLDVVDKTETVITLPGKLRAAWARYEARRMGQWWEEIVLEFRNCSTGESWTAVEEKLYNLAERDLALKVLSQSTKTLLEALDDAVLVPLAILTAEYLSQGKQADPIFRGLCRALSDMCYAHLRILRQIFIPIDRRMDQMLAVENDRTIRLIHLIREPNGIYELHMQWKDGRIVAADRISLSDAEPLAYEAILLLNRNGLLEQRGAPGTVYLVSAEVTRLITKVLREPEAARKEQSAPPR